MNALTLDGYPVNSSLIEKYTAADLASVHEQGRKLGREFAENLYKVQFNDLKAEYRLLTNALAGALLALDGGKLTPEMRKTLDGALQRAEEICNG